MDEKNMQIHWFVVIDCNSNPSKDSLPVLVSVSSLRNKFQYCSCDKCTQRKEMVNSKYFC